MLSARSEILAEKQTWGPRHPMSSLHGMGVFWGGKPKSVTSSSDPRPQPPRGTATDLTAGECEETEADDRDPGRPKGPWQSLSSRLWTGPGAGRQDTAPAPPLG